MNRLGTVLLLSCALALTGCNKKKNDHGGTASGSGSAAVGSGSGSAPVAPPVPAGPTCPPGNVLKDNACTPVVTADNVAAIGQQQTRLDELAAYLDQAQTIAVPLELLSAMRQLPEWQKLQAAGGDKFKVVDDLIGTLGQAVTQMRALQGALKTGSTRLGNIKGELDTIMTNTGAAQQLAAVRAQVTTEVHAAVDTVSKEVVATIQKVVLPVKQQLEDVSDIVIGACAIAKMQGGSDQLKEKCAKAKEQFNAANAFIADFETKPQEMMTQLTSQLEAQLGQLIDDTEKQALAAAQQAVNDALKLPPRGAGSAGSAGSGAATP